MNRYITIHCAATPNGRAFDIKDVDAWHKERGFKRNPGWYMKYRSNLKHVGYHFVITLDGEVQPGRHPDETGAHVGGYNTDNIGVCMIGTDRFTSQQWNALKLLVADLMSAYPTVAAVMGHRDWPNVKKDCPGFDVGKWFVEQAPDTINIQEKTNDT